jgi:hypothetical protein
MQARAPQPITFDQGHFRTVSGSSERSHIPAGASTDHDDLHADILN